MKPKEYACRVEDNGVYDADHNIRYAVAIEILGAEIETAWIEVADHLAKRALHLAKITEAER